MILRAMILKEIVPRRRFIFTRANYLLDNYNLIYYTSAKIIAA